MKVTCLVACLALTAFPRFAAAQNDMAERAQRSERVIVATVVDVAPVFDVNEFGDQLIVSKLTLRVDETMKGPADKSVELSVEGGTIGDLTLDVSDMPTLKRGERAAFFVDRAKDGSLVPHGRGQGIMKLDVSNRVEGSDLSLDDVRRAVRGRP
jgi:hypothetical protein